MPLPLEDNYTDILAKAQRGLLLNDHSIASAAGVTVEQWKSLLGGEFDPAVAAAVAQPLGLDAAALAAVAHGTYRPAETAEIEGLAQFTTDFGDMTVNAYMIWDKASGEAAAFDTGGDCGEMVELAESLGLTMRFLFLTHTHGDHIYDMDRFKERTHARVLVSSRETTQGAETFDPGRDFMVGRLMIGTRLTWGHSRGGTTYCVTGLAQPVAVVGDALFAGSMGGGAASYQDALRTGREEIFSLPPETILCPGHGPMTTVGEERMHNAFFAGKS